VAWEQGQELPVGFTKRPSAFPASPTTAPPATPPATAKRRLQPGFRGRRAGHTVNIQNFFRLLIDCARDPRFNADILMAEINRVTDLDAIDRLLYRFLIIPITKKRLLEREAQFAWLYRPDFPDWGRGRDDGMNLTKYFMIRAPMDDTFGPADIPAVWNLGKYHGTRASAQLRRRHPRRAFGDDRLGPRRARRRAGRQGGLPRQVKWLQDYLTQLPPPKYPSRSTPPARPPGWCSTPTAPPATPANAPARRSRWPRSAPTAAASIPGTKRRRSRPTHRCRHGHQRRGWWRKT
jgi:hypothetical protein